MDFENLDADVDLILDRHFTPGRGGARVDKVVVHYNAANLTSEGCLSVWRTRPASAHYQVEESGRIGQLVHDWDTAWHCGNFAQNRRSIGVEHTNRPDGTVSGACLDAGAHLVAALCLRFGLGEPAWGVNVFPHSAFSPTSCPGQLYGSQREEYIGRARRWYAAMSGAAPAPQAAPAPAPAPQPAPGGLEADGLWGSSTTRALQRLLGTPADGSVSSQPAAWRGRNPGLTTGWEWTASPVGSQVVAEMQRRMGVTADGMFGPATANALISRFMGESGATVLDGRIDAGSPTVRAMQRALNEGRF